MSENLFGLNEDVHNRFDALHQIIGHTPEYNDSLDDSINNLCIAFGLSQQGLLKKLQEVADFDSNPDAALGHLVQRPKGGFMRVMLHYLNPHSLEDLNAICDSWIEQKEKVAQAHSNSGIRQYTFRRSEAGKVEQGCIVEYLTEFGENGPEFLMKAMGIRSIAEFNKLFFENPQAADFCRVVNPKIFKFFIQRYNINTVNKLLDLVENEEFTSSMNSLPGRDDSYGDNITDYADNLVKVLTAFNVYDIKQLVRITHLENTNKVLRNASAPNLNVLFEVAEPANEGELERICNNAQLSSNISDTNYEALKSLLEHMGLLEEDVNRYSYEVITHSYNDRISKIVSDLRDSLAVMETPAKLPQLVMRMLRDEDYIEQNLSTLQALVGAELITTNNSTDNLNELMDLMGGFVTPELSKKYINTTSAKERRAVISSYQGMMGQVLSSEPIEVDDADLLSEIIYLAYRPTGYSVSQIKEMIHWNEINDLTSQISNIKFQKEGYKMHFNLMAREQVTEFDIGKLRKVDEPLYQSVNPKEIGDLFKFALSKKPKYSHMMPLLLSHLLKKTDDDRVNEYCDTYHSDKSIKRVYTPERLESLSEILGIIPKEDEFKALVKDIFEHEDVQMVVNAASNIYMWQENKRYMNKQQRAAKTRVDEVLKHLGDRLDSDVSDLMNTKEMECLSEIEKLRNLKGEELKAALIQTKEKVFLGYDKEDESKPTDYVDVFYNQILAQAKDMASIVRREYRKVQSIRTDKANEVTAVISKNMGSYFAKAGAEICTSHNMRMWREERHIHLNMVYKNQIIGNVMLYFEEGRDYMVARGFNPRKDTMLKYDRYGMARALVDVVSQVAKANGYQEVFIPEQTGWHALSNRDGMAKEIMGIARKTQNEALKTSQRATIEDANFYVTETGGTSFDRLILLSMVK